MYILTLVDYATRYPEAVPLKNIDTKTVAEGLLNIYIVQSGWSTGGSSERPWNPVYIGLHEGGI